LLRRSPHKPLEGLAEVKFIMESKHVGKLLDRRFRDMIKQRGIGDSEDNQVAVFLMA
jgi:hypothetical protein